MFTKSNSLGIIGQREDLVFSRGTVFNPPHQPPSATQIQVLLSQYDIESVSQPHEKRESHLIAKMRNLLGIPHKHELCSLSKRHSNDPDSDSDASSSSDSDSDSDREAEVHGESRTWWSVRSPPRYHDDKSDCESSHSSPASDCPKKKKKHHKKHKHHRKHKKGNHYHSDDDKHKHPEYASDIGSDYGSDGSDVGHQIKKLRKSIYDSDAYDTTDLEDLGKRAQYLLKTTGHSSKRNLSLSDVAEAARRS